LTGLLIPGMAFAEKIIWVSAGDVDSTGAPVDSGFIELLVNAGHEVQLEGGTMTGTELSDEQVETLESGDLIILSRALSSGDYNAPASWNEIYKPMLCTTAYLVRTSRWQWLDTDAMIGGGDSGAPLMVADMPDHQIFDGVTLDENNQVKVLDETVGSGNTSLMQTEEYGDGTLIASVVEPYSAWIVHWPKDGTFHGGTDYYAADARLWFGCGTRESTATPAVPEHVWGTENLTPDGEKMFLNAVDFMLGKVNSVSDIPQTIPSEFELAQNYPNPFNPSTTINFSIPKTENVTLKVFNVLGEEIATLVDGSFQPGTHSATWNGLDAAGNTVVSGVYLYRLQSESQTLTKKMILVK
jgi:hypothetical protein